MKNKILISTLMLGAFTIPSFAQTNVEPYPGLEGLDCVALVEKLDVTLEEVTIADELRLLILEQREKGVEEKKAGDEEACVTSLKAAFQLLVPKE